MATVDTDEASVDAAEGSHHDDYNRPSLEDPKEAKGKKKFRPLEKMRKFFKSTKKSKSKDVGSVSGKAKSTGALYQEASQSEDDDDGGFRSPLPLGGARSISEDSVFKPEQKESTLDNLREKTVSMEAVNTGFQRELFNKLRRRQISRSDEDDGLPQSPNQLTSSDLFIGGGLQPLPSTGKSTSRESDNSLISIGSDHDDDFFKSDWQSAVASVKKSRSSAGSQSDSSMDQNLDFAVVLRNTQPLSTDAAKHRISIKPKSRRSSVASSSRRNREISTATPPLPSLNEESPTKPTADKPLITTHENKTSIQVKALPKKPETPSAKVEDRNVNVNTNSGGVTVTKQSENVSKTLKTDNTSVVTRNKTTEFKSPDKTETNVQSSAEKESGKQLVSPKHSVEARGYQLNRQRPKSLMVESGAKFPSSKEEKGSNSELSQAFNKIKRLSLKRDTINSSDLAAFSNDGKTIKEIDTSVNTKPKSEPLKEVDILNKQDVKQESAINEKTSVSKQESLSKTEQISVSNVENKSPTSPVKKSSPTSTIPSSNVTYVLKKEPLRSPPSVSSPDYENVQLKSPKSPISSPEHDYDNVPVQISSFYKKGDKLPDKKEEKVPEKESPTNRTTHVPTDTKTSPNKLPTPNEEYRLKRQARSKTLPEQPVPREILDAKASNISSNVSLRTRTDSCNDSKPSAQTNLSRSFTTSRTDSVKKEVTKVGGLESGGKKTEPKRMSWVGSSSSAESNTSGQPSWITMAKKKHESNEGKTKSEPKGSEQNEVKVKVEQKESSKPAVSVINTKESEKGSRFGSKFEPQKAGATTSTKEEKEKINGTKKVPETKSETKSETAQKPPLRAKPADLAKTSSAPDKKSSFENSPSTSSTVPAWKANLSQKRNKDGKEPNVKIEIIEKSNQNIATKPEEKRPSVQLRNKPVTEKCGDVAKSNTKSSVLDMVKNFQKLQPT